MVRRARSAIGRLQVCTPEVNWALRGRLSLSDCNLVVEVDGGQHAESESDQIRDAFLVSEGYRVLRFWNSDVLGNIDGVLQTILASLNSPTN
jgi:very-short-patch-repair endonuclease